MKSIFSNRGSRVNHRLPGLILAVCLSLWMELTSGQGSNVTAAVGQTVTLQAPATTLINSYIWYRGGEANAQKRILTYFASPPNQINGPEHRGRETGLSNGSLLIKDVQTMDTGSYLVIMTLTHAGTPQSIQQLTVYGNSAPDNSASDWKIAVGVSVGVLLFAALIATGVVLWYKRRTRTLKAENTHENPVMVQDPDPHYENVRKGNPGPSATQTTDADSAYMALTHKDQATYDQLKRSKT